MDFLFRRGPVLEAPGDDVEFPRTQLHRAVPELDAHPALEHEEELVRLGMGVPDERDPEA